MIDLDNDTNLKLELPALENIATTLSPYDVELIIVDDIRMQCLNLAHRGKNKSTDVLSFPLDLPKGITPNIGMPLGSIVISVTAVQTQAKAYGHSAQEELSLLFIHGLLHLLGFDHEVDAGQMREKEASLIEQFSLPSSLIIRTQH